MALGKLTIDLAANIAKFESDMGRAAYIAKKHATAIREEFTKIGEVFLAGLGIEKMAAFASEIAETGHALEEMSQKVGVSASDLSAFKLVADQSGLSMEQLQTGFDKFSKTATEAAGGAKLQAAEFKALGINIDDANGHIKPMRELIDETAKKFASFRDSNVKTADAMALFGKSGAELIPFLNRLGSEGFDGALAEAKKFGVYMGEDSIKASEEYRQEIIKLHEIVDGFGILIVNAVTPALKGMIGVVTDFATETSTAAGRTQAMKEFVMGLSEGCIELEGTARKAAAGIEAIAEVISRAIDLVAQTPFARIGEDINKMTAATSGVFDRVSAGADLRGIIADQSKQVDLFAKNLRSIRDETVQVFTNIDGDIGKQLASFVKHSGDSDPAANSASKGKLDAPVLPAIIQGSHARARIDPAIRAAADFQKQMDDLAASLSGPASQALAKFDDEQAKFKKLAVDGKESAGELAKALRLVGLERDDAFAEIRANALGPVAEEAYQYGKAVRDLNDDHEHGVLDAKQFAAALAVVEEAHRKNTIAAQRELDPLGALIDDMKFETDELGKTNIQRQADNFLRQQGIPLLSKQAAGIRSIIEAQAALNEQMQKSIALQDSFRNDAANFFDDILSGSKSATNAFKDFAISVLGDIEKMFSQNLAEKLFGQLGQNGGGKFGGWLSGITGDLTGGNDQAAALMDNTRALEAATAAYSNAAIGGSLGGAGGLASLFGGSGDSSWLSGLFGSTNSIVSSPDFSALSLFPGYAGGGDTPANQPFWVGERGPELMYSRTPGTVVPNHRLADVGRSTVNNFNIAVQPTSTRRTAEQVANETARKQRVASARNA